MESPPEKPEPEVIQVSASEVNQLFNTLDPSPFHDRDLDDDAEAYIVGWARELPEEDPVRITVFLPRPEAQKAEAQGLGTAFRNFFDYRAGMFERGYREQLRQGRRFLISGLIVLSVSLLIAHVLQRYGSENPIAQLLAEGLTIFGWVANWRPAEIFLYDIWETRRTCRLYRRLAAAEVSLSAR